MGASANLLFLEVHLKTSKRTSVEITQRTRALTPSEANLASGGASTTTTTTSFTIDPIVLYPKPRLPIPDPGPIRIVSL